MRKRKFVITINMLNAGEVALRRCREAGGHNAQSVCREVFLAMLDASACVLPSVRQPTTKNYVPSQLPNKNTKLDQYAKVAALWASMPKLQGRPLPPTIIYPDRLPDNECRSSYWYLAPSYDRDLRRIIADPKQRAKLKFWPVAA